MAMAMTSALATAYPGQYSHPSGMSIESDYIKTFPVDLAAIEAAKVRRERRAAQRLANNVKSQNGRLA